MEKYNELLDSLQKEVQYLKGVSENSGGGGYVFSQEAKEIRIYPDVTAPQLEEREDGVLYFCETEEDTEIEPMEILMGKGNEVVSNDVSYGKLPLNEGSLGKLELFAPKKSKKKEEQKDGLVLVCKIPSENYVQDLSQYLAAVPGDGTTIISINWGDKSATVDYQVSETKEAGTITHTYATAGEYEITLKGSFKWGRGGFFASTKPVFSIQETLTDIKLPSGESPIKDLDTYAFNACINLTRVPARLFDNCTKTTDFSGCFCLCSSLKSIPQSLFYKCTASTNFSTCFQRCTSLTSIPVGLFDKCTAVTKLELCFEGCTGITSIPYGFFDKLINLTSLAMCFESCSITNIPTGLFDKCTKIQFFTYCFQDCINLASIPVGLFDKCTLVTSFTQCFKGCINLTSIPVGLFDKCTLVEHFWGTFYGCTSLTSIPVNLFAKCTKVLNIEECFYNCISVTGALPTLWNFYSSYVVHRECFYNCTNASNYAAALAAGWA